ncbi:hypothetical protein ACKKBF_B37540 [Auxenochlorella protothecoides x Auxenochlorella symbiontica]
MLGTAVPSLVRCAPAGSTFTASRRHPRTAHLRCLHAAPRSSQLRTPGRPSWALSAEEGDGASPSTATMDPPSATDAEGLLAEAREVASTRQVTDAFAATFPERLEYHLRAASEGGPAGADAALSALRDQHLRLAADYDNFRKRSAAERDSARTAARGDTVLELLAVVDSFEQAAAALSPATDGERKVVAAYDAVYRQLVAAFRRLGVEAVPGEGEPFDPAVHEAIMREPAPAGVPDGTVVQEFRKGFRLGDKLLRAGMVKVAFAEDEPTQGGEEEA